MPLFYLHYIINILINILMLNFQYILATTIFNVIILLETIFKRGNVHDNAYIRRKERKS